MKSRTIGVAATATMCMSLTAAACASSGTSASSVPSHSPAAAGSGRPSAAGSGAPATAGSGAPATAGSGVAVKTGAFGAACAKVPATGMGSFSAMAAAPVATAASHNPLLSELADAVQAAGLTSTLNSARSITVFAPDNAAFAALGRGNLSTLMASRSDLIKVLQFHVVNGRQTPADLASGKHLTTLLGTTIVPSMSGGSYLVNNARVICGNVQTANATVYIINKVLVPLP
jgi:uncharacterized surface protein with fasciclin (FAS1) repeats